MKYAFVLIFKKENNKLISKNSEIFANEILKLFGEKTGKLTKYYPYKYIRKDAEEYGDCFIHFVFIKESYFFIKIHILFLEDSYSIQIRVEEDQLERLGKAKEEIQQKLINFGEEMIKQFNLSEAFVCYNYLAIPDDFNFLLKDLESQKVKDQVNFILLKDGNNIKFIKGNTNIYGEDEI